MPPKYATGPNSPVDKWDIFTELGCLIKFFLDEFGQPRGSIFTNSPAVVWSSWSTQNIKKN